tara:strand:- start:772 stop:1011 length:240 start_codon:yes stop_codon:yes gene_type:complete
MILKSGEELISDINEMAVGEEDDQKVIGYFLRRPCIVKMKNPGVIDKKDTEIRSGFEVTRFPGLLLLKKRLFQFLPIGW